MDIDANAKDWFPEFPLNPRLIAQTGRFSPLIADGIGDGYLAVFGHLDGEDDRSAVDVLIFVAG